MHAGGERLTLMIGPVPLGDGEPIEVLLRSVGLPLHGLDPALPFAVAARDRDRLVGVAALEPRGAVGLLRSVASGSGTWVFYRRHVWPSTTRLAWRG